MCHFDTTALPDKPITSAILKLYSSSAVFDTLSCTPSLDVVGHTATPANYDYTNYALVQSTLFGSKAKADWNSSGWNEITLNADGRAAIVPGGYTPIALRISYDRLNSPPSWGAYKGAAFQFVGRDSTPGPILSITYTTISVQTDPATEISSLSARLNGTLLDDGDDTPVQCGFQWGKTVTYNNAVSVGNVTESSTFSVVIGNNLEPGQTYHFRAFAVGASGAIVYGADRTFIASNSSADTRVTSIIRYFSAGPDPVYQMEILRGGVGGVYIPPTLTKKPYSTEDTTAPVSNWMNLTSADYSKWISTHTLKEMKAIFGKQPTFTEWAMWKVGGGSK
jgi:hypothetical protein